MIMFRMLEGEKRKEWSHGTQ